MVKQTNVRIFLAKTILLSGYFIISAIIELILIFKLITINDFDKKKRRELCIENNRYFTNNFFSLLDRRNILR